MAEAGGKLTMRGHARHLVWAAILANILVAASGPARADPSSTFLGRWLTQNRDGVFQIQRCGNTLCGRLVGMRYSHAMPLDFRHQPQCGQMLLSGFLPTDDPDRWHGSIVNPDSGNSYGATIWSPEPNVLKLRGYLLLPIFGETQSWSRYGGPIGAACKLPD